MLISTELWQTSACCLFIVSGILRQILAQVMIKMSPENGGSLRQMLAVYVRTCNYSYRVCVGFCVVYISRVMWQRDISYLILSLILSYLCVYVCLVSPCLCVCDVIGGRTWGTTKWTKFYSLPHNPRNIYNTEANTYSIWIIATPDLLKIYN